METIRLLAVAANGKRAAYVFFDSSGLADWRISEKAARSPAAAKSCARQWIKELHPQVLVTADVTTTRTKGEKAKRAIAAIARTAEDKHVLHVAIDRRSDYTNKYDEAQELTVRYGELKPWLPEKRRFFENEPRNIILFEALALAEHVRRGPTTGLAAAMG